MLYSMSAMLTLLSILSPTLIDELPVVDADLYVSHLVDVVVAYLYIVVNLLVVELYLYVVDELSLFVVD